MTSTEDAEDPDPPPGPPDPRRDPVVRELHGVRRVDDYAWLSDTTSAEVREHLAAERAWYEAATVHRRSLVEVLTAEMGSRLPRTDRSVSWQRVRYSYYKSTPAGSEYAQLLRVRHPSKAAHATESVAESRFGRDLGGRPMSPPEPVLDPADLADGSGYVDLGVCEVSPDERLLAYSVDLSGNEVYRLRFRDLDRGADLPDEVPRSYFTGAWSADSSTFFYTVHDKAYRPHEVWRHVLGTPLADDTRVLHEPNERFTLEVRLTRSGDLIVLGAHSRDTGEVWLVDAHDPTAPARCVEPRRGGVEYDVEHTRDADGSGALLVLTDDDATEFRLARADPAAPGRAGWSTVVPEDPAERITAVDAFAGAVVLSLRRAGSPLLRVLPHGGGTPFDVAPTLPAGRIALARNEVWDTATVTVVEESYVHAPAWWDVDLRTGARTLRHRQPVPGHDPGRYVTERIGVPGAAVVSVPVTVTRHRDTPLDGSAPCLLWGYGAYESCDDPEFDPALPSLLDRGVVHVHAHVRGGGENGRWWWLDGRMRHKQHTFDDHVAVAEHVRSGLVDPARVATRGLSAGGLLQAVVFSQRPDLWRAVVAEVPFVDVLTTMLDPSVPLTAGEWDEWGDPRRAEDFGWMLAYSPYDNVPPAGGRPELLVTGAVHDPRVLVREPAKWVAALRASDQDWSAQCLFRCETAAGAHTGPSGRYAHLGYEAEVYAWLLDRLDAAG